MAEQSDEQPLPTSDSFLSRWKDYLNRVGLDTKFPLIRLPAPDDRITVSSARFIAETGLPDAAGFYFLSLDRGLRKIYEAHSPGDDWNVADRQRLAPYLMLGSDGGGNPVCLDLANRERIVLLDHERHFEVAAFVNSSVWQLAECILLFQEMVETYQNEASEEAELYEGNVPAPLVERTLQAMARIDSPAAEENSYWPTAMDFI